MNVTGARGFSAGAWQLLSCFLFLERRRKAHRTQLARTKKRRTLVGNDGAFVVWLLRASRKLLEKLGSGKRDPPVSDEGGGGMKRCG